MNGFPQKSVEQLLVACHRRCCICHRWCGTKMEIDHIVQRADGGSNEMENAIALCFDCHAEAHAYNPRHPRGRRFTAAELRAHREQWLQLCKEHPETLIGPWRDADVGPLQAMIDELEFDAALAERIAHGHELLPMLHVDQFKRAIAAGAISGLRDEIKAVVLDAYGAIERANAALRRIESSLAGSAGTSVSGSSRTDASKAYAEAGAGAKKAVEELLRFLGSETPPEGRGA
jgi:HNH endonuclease